VEEEEEEGRRMKDEERGTMRWGDGKEGGEERRKLGGPYRGEGISRRRMRSGSSFAILFVEF